MVAVSMCVGASNLYGRVELWSNVAVLFLCSLLLGASTTMMFCFARSSLHLHPTVAHDHQVCRVMGWVEGSGKINISRIMVPPFDKEAQNETPFLPKWCQIFQPDQKVSKLQEALLSRNPIPECARARCNR